MAPNNSRHRLPLQSVLFDSRILLTPSRLKTEYNPTLANLNEAQDTSITAMPPMPPLPTTIKEQPPVPAKKSAWRRLRNKVKKLFRRKKRDELMRISSPAKFEHEAPGGLRPFRTVLPQAGKVAGAKTDAGGTAVEEADESDWEDVEETRIFGRR